MDPFKPAEEAARNEDKNTSRAAATHGGTTADADTAMAVKFQLELDAAIALSLQTTEDEGFFLEDDMQQSMLLSTCSSHTDSDQKLSARDTLLGEEIMDKMDDYEGAIFDAVQNPHGCDASGMGFDTGLVASDQTTSDTKGGSSLHADSDDEDDNDKKPAARTDITEESFAFIDTDAALARALHEQEIDSTITEMDAALALSLQEEEHSSLAFGTDNSDYNVARAPIVAQTDDSSEFDTNLDEQLAISQAQEEHERDLDEQLAIFQTQEEHEIAMKSTFSGKAWTFVEAVVEEHKRLSKSGGFKMDTVAVDDMLAMVERFAEAHSVFKFDGKDTHYTRGDNLDQIQTTGLLTKVEREAKGVENNYNGSAWGDGVYTGNNPHAFSSYGDIGLLVARLKGHSIPATCRGRGFKGDTAIANEGSAHEMVILSQSYQCIPLLYFRRVDAYGCHVFEIIWTFHCKLQEIVDTLFNNGTKTGLNHSQLPAHWSVDISRRPTLPRPPTRPVPVSGPSSYQLWKRKTSDLVFELPSPMNS